MSEADQNRRASITGCLLGTAVGDALGLAYEGISPRRAARMFGEPNGFRFFFGHGMVSDDTEHTCLVAQALIASGGDVERFQADLARRFRWWLLALPAGVGLATLRAIMKLWLGFGPQRSGVFSAGNGPAMRAAILGATVSDLEQLKELVRASSQITHTDPKATYGAFAVSLAARMASQRNTDSGEHFVELLRSTLGPDASELHERITQAVHSVNDSQSTEAFAVSIGLVKGVTGYVYHTVPVAIHAWLSHPHDYRAAVSSAVRCGGDTDTVAAITGGIVGAAVGPGGIPAEWLERLIEWPQSVGWMKQLGIPLDQAPTPHTVCLPQPPSLWKILPRNLLFLFIVLFHGFRRLLPPY